MPRLVVTVRPDGGVETLLKDTVLDTRIFGDRRVERITIIEHDEREQNFYIQWLKGPFAGQVHTVDTAGQVYTRLRRWQSDEAPVIRFSTYEEAVAEEIAMVNELRIKGFSFS